MEDISHSCYLCNKVFSQGSSLYRHIRRIHESEPVFPNSNPIKCSLCPTDRLIYSCSNIRKLEDHMTAMHGIQFQVKNLVFETKEEFFDWKVKIETETCAKYVQNNGTKRTNDTSRTVYSCNRSGHYVPSGTGKRSLKTQGSCKINGHCPARITVNQSGSEDDHVLLVEFVTTHVGHEKDLSHLTLQKADRDLLANSLRNGEEMTKILEIHRSLDEPPTRKHLLNRKDLHNIAALYKIDSPVLKTKELLTKKKLDSAIKVNMPEKCRIDNVSKDSDSEQIQCKSSNSVLHCETQNHILRKLPKLNHGEFSIVIMNESQDYDVLDCVANDPASEINNLVEVVVEEVETDPSELRQENADFQKLQEELIRFSEKITDQIRHASTIEQLNKIRTVINPVKHALDVIVKKETETERNLNIVDRRTVSDIRN